MADDDDKPLRLVAQNDESAIEAHREEALVEKVRVSFATAAANVLDFLAGSPRSDMIEAMRAFLAVVDAADKETSDPKGSRVRIPDIEPRKAGEPDTDAAINTALRGALRMEAALLRHNATTDNEDYEHAKQEFARGVVMLNQKIEGLTRRS
jgi:hypothetical protein